VKPPQTIAAKLKAFVPEAYDYIINSDEVTLGGLKKIVQKTSSGTDVKPFSQIPANANASEGTGAYFHCKFKINPVTNEIKEAGKAIYVNPPQNMSVVERLKFLGSVIHEMTHIFQEEAADRLGKLKFLQQFLNKDISSTQKIETLQVMPKIFTEAEYAIQKPYLRAFAMKDYIPRPVTLLSQQALNEIYLETVNSPVDSYIARAIHNSMGKASHTAPNYDKQTVIDYILATSQNEREAYLTSTNLLKTALSIKAPTDQDYRILLYNRFIDVAGNM